MNQHSSIDQDKVYQLSVAIRSMIFITDRELDRLLRLCVVKTYTSGDYLSQQNHVSDEIFFIYRGLTRSVLMDQNQNEHTLHFYMKNQFACDYASFLSITPATSGIQAIAETEVISMPRIAMEWSYQNLKNGDRFGRLMAERWVTHFDNLVKRLYLESPQLLHKKFDQIFPGVRDKVPPHMIFSYLEIAASHAQHEK